MNRRVTRTVLAAGWLVCAGGTLAAPARGQGAAPVVYVLTIDGVVDLGLAPYVARTLREAKAAGADAVVLEINTFGGRVDAAVAIRDHLLSSPVRTIGFVNQRAISAGALIALACDTLVMARGGTIGAAAPVLGGAGESLPADEKTVSYLRKEFRATADARGRPPQLAEAMVDADVAVAGIIDEGKLLTMTATEALEYKVANRIADTLDAALEAAGLPGATTLRIEETWAESVVRFLTHPVVSSLLMTVGLLGILIEIRTPGFGVPGAIGLMALGLFFWGHWIVQLAGWEELLLLIVGIALVAAEVLVIPGTSVAGVAGVVALVAGLAMVLVGAGATGPVVMRALGRVALSILIAMVGTLVLLRLLPQLPFGRRLILDTGMTSGLGWVSTPESDHHWLGRTGVASSPLRPAGIATIDGARVDVVSDGAFIEAGAAVAVTRVDGNRIVVALVREAATTDVGDT
ncbi:MAG TPA: NfeD family protein [Vicinamibacterales bacterium]|nr:NfeD family protein [Vicinamibacterales bacterium]